MLHVLTSFFPVHQFPPPCQSPNSLLQRILRNDFLDVSFPLQQGGDFFREAYIASLQET
jgi:hypothetical protein